MVEDEEGVKVAAMNGHEDTRAATKLLWSHSFLFTAQRQQH